MASIAKSPSVLLTGFDAFGEDRHKDSAANPSWLAVNALQGQHVAGHLMVAAQLPTQFGASTTELLRLVHLHQPVLVICTGLAGGRAALSLERIAINLDDARIPDNAGEQPVDEPVVAGGPAAYFSRLPVKAMRLAIENAGVPAEVSQSAGTFVCNHVFYALMHTLATQPTLTKTRGGFMHVPFLAGQGRPCLALADMVLGLRVAVEVALTSTDDIVQTAGTIS